MKKKILAGLVGALLPVVATAADEAKTVPPGTPVTITVKTAEPAAPKVSITLGARQARVTPVRKGFTHTGGGNIKVDQPTSDTIVLTMTGVAVAGGHPATDSVASLAFDLNQCFEVAFDDPAVKQAKLTIEARVIGLLRSDDSKKSSGKNGGHADYGCATTTVCGATGGQSLSLTVQSESASCGVNQSINYFEGPLSATIVPGQYTLHQVWSVSASHPRGFGKAASAEFAPDPALDPLWISHWEPFHGAAKGDFGLVVTIKVADDTKEAPAANGNGNGNGKDKPAADK